MLQEYISETNAPDAAARLPVIELASPDALRAAFAAAGAPLALGAGDAPAPPAALEAALAQVLRFSARTSHPLFYNQLYARVEPAALAAEWASAATNTNVHTFEVAPVHTLLENEVIAKLASYVGFAPEEQDGLLVPGGSAANLYALHLARHRAYPDARAKGLAAAVAAAGGGGAPVAFTSEQSHYSYTKAAALTGLGTDNLVAVAADAAGALRPDALEAAIAAAIAAGRRPFFVGLTAGTTVLGAFDPVKQVAEICRRHQIWLHVDACWGGALLLSPEHR